MKVIKSIVISSLLSLTLVTASKACESGHWVQSKTSDGSIVTLEDGSVWKISSIDTIDSSLWLPTDSIVVCDWKLINTDDNSTVEASRIN